MRSIGVRELRQQASRYLRTVEQGDTIEVTDRGRPVALIVPARGQGIDLLLRSGRLTPASGDALELGAPLAPKGGVPLPSEILADARAHER